ncbi:ATP-grasp domain-containing protein [Eubacterium barkeri]|nr:ATP-grasp domain-containing protein [Eubacterium barkeri]
MKERGAGRMVKKKVMILGASIGQVSIINKAKELGYEVAVVDQNENAVGIQFSDVFFHASTIDENAVTEIAKKYRPDGITTVQTDMPVRAIAKACSECGLTGISYDTAIKATDKQQMIEAFKASGISSPWYFVVENGKIDSVLDELIYPCIFKPVDNSGSRGISLVENKQCVKEALLYSTRNSKNGKILIEEYLRGPEVSVEIFMIDGVAHILAITDKLTTGAPHFVEIGHSEQTQLDEKSKEDIAKLAKDAMLTIGVFNGPGHVEIILTKDGPKMVELGARLGGDFITTDLVPLATGVDLLAATLQMACGEEPNLEIKFDKGSAIRFIAAEEGIIESIQGIREAKNIKGTVKVEMLKDVGQIIQPLKSSLDRVGYIIAQGNTPEEAIEKCSTALEKINIRIRKI